MLIRTVVIVALFFFFFLIAYEVYVFFFFFIFVKIFLRSSLNVSHAYTKPDTVTWALQNTSLSGRLGFGGTDFRDNAYTAYGGLQINIPLSSIKEEREQALKQVAETKAVVEIQTKVIQDIAQLRTFESELAASEVRRKFLKQKAAWLKDRIDKGYSSEIDKLWQIGSKLNAEDALIAKIAVLAKTQRYKLAKYAGTEWKTLLAYLEGRKNAIGGSDG